MPCSAPCNSRTPSIMIRRVRAFDFSPILFKNISQVDHLLWKFPITVKPSAGRLPSSHYRYNRRFGAELLCMLITAPVSFGAKTLMSPPSTRCRASSFDPTCRSIGRSPMTQPPGKATHSLQRPSDTHARTEARILARQAQQEVDFFCSDADGSLARSRPAPDGLKLQHVMGVAQMGTP